MEPLTKVRSCRTAVAADVELNVEDYGNLPPESATTAGLTVYVEDAEEPREERNGGALQQSRRPCQLARGF